MKVTSEGPLKPSPPTVLLTVTVTVIASPSARTPVTARLTRTPMNSLSLRPLIASRPRNSRPPVEEAARREKPYQPHPVRGRS